MMLQQSTILWNRRVSGQCFHMGLACPQGYENAQPGQFVMLQVAAELSPLLRRPFSIYGLIGEMDKPEGIELLYKVVGPGTRKLAELRSRQTVSLLGPLGRGFRSDVGHKNVYLAAGGIGVAPLRFLAARHRALGADMDVYTLFLGAQTRDDLLCQDEFARLGVRIVLTTDDGSAGDQCLLTDPLTRAVESEPPDILYACGPKGMLRCILDLARQKKIACQLSIETYMACGIGACLGCAVADRDAGKGYLHACKDGPVFDAEALSL